jgi:UDP-N-acetylglucosamine diphosphorylase / glucose-1-phosphate thymidylyltransferase / UDP-N-acetylgalactosamine diphosphorylase / glucosamine-1-phosphate N-acetyltransferase / galactosamine-1-phosphate N-acetyltransferase
MTALQLLLFDDRTARGWEPFALTRPAGELLLGTMTLRQRAEHVFGATCAGHIAADHLLGFEEAGAPRVLGPDTVPRGGDRLILSSRAVPDPEAAKGLEGVSTAVSLRLGGQPAGWYLPDGAPAPDPELLLDPTAGPDAVDLPGRMLHHVWDLVARNPEQIAADVAHLHPAPGSPALPHGVHHFGEHVLVLGEGAHVEPGVVLDTSNGPIWLDEGSSVRAFTRLAGPAYVGRGSTILGGPVEAVSIGPVCKVRGELAESVCLGYVNKAHDGHMGHAYLGRWVNLGAETTNSDLKNNYGTIRIWTPEGDKDTGEIKLGSLLGDHVKTGIGLLLNTGTVVGAGSNLFGSAMPDKYVPPFSWGSGEELVEFRLDKFMEVAERAMSRRGVELSQGMRAQLERAWIRGRQGGETAR